MMDIMTVAFLILATNAAAVRSFLLKLRGKHDGAEETWRRRGRVVFTEENFPIRILLNHVVYASPLSAFGLDKNELQIPQIQVERILHVSLFLSFLSKCM